MSLFADVIHGFVAVGDAPRDCGSAKFGVQRIDLLGNEQGIRSFEILAWHHGLRVKVTAMSRDIFDSGRVVSPPTMGRRLVPRRSIEAGLHGRGLVRIVRQSLEETSGGANGAAMEGLSVVVDCNFRAESAEIDGWSGAGGGGATETVLSEAAAEL